MKYRMGLKYTTFNKKMNGQIRNKSKIEIKMWSKIRFIN
jgi:hypothetical protein